MWLKVAAKRRACHTVGWNHASLFSPSKVILQFMKHIPHGKTIDDFDALLPWNVNKDPLQQKEIIPKEA